ncbi:hypothetical protein ABW21_db0201715 [Orbilia brochopaga]|nr:hypothetical protein ABW21_db0201715 [Drechslerella brochopaga]
MRPLLLHGCFSTSLLLLLRLTTPSYGQLVWDKWDPDSFACRIGIYESEDGTKPKGKQYLEVSPDGEGLCPENASGCCLKMKSFENTDSFLKNIGSLRFNGSAERDCQCRFYDTSDSCVDKPNAWWHWLRRSGPLGLAPKPEYKVTGGVLSFKCTWSDKFTPPPIETPSASPTSPEDPGPTDGKKLDAKDPNSLQYQREELGVTTF